MSIHNYDPAISWHEGSCVTVGVFDGVHLGHRALIDKTIELAKSKNLKSVALTFDPHPLALLKPEAAPKMVYDIQKRCELILECGIDEVVIIQFDKTMALQSAEQFVASVLVKSLNSKFVVVGQDFKFGHNREGDLSYLKLWGSKLGFEAVGISLVTDGLTRVSSTLLRSAIAEGNLSISYKIMSRNFSYIGEVIHGDSRGKEMGFPTANLKIDSNLVIPAQGVYCGYCFIGSQAKVAAISIGIRPTFVSDAPVSFEVYILDFTESLYGKSLEVFLVEKLREEIKFESVDDLLVQMKHDVERSVEIVSKLNIWQ